jgi:hypothetical protein
MNAFSLTSDRPRTAWVWLVLAGWFAALGSRAQDFPLPETSAIAIQAPQSGARYTLPAKVVFEAEAVDPLGDIRHLEFFANGEFVGASDYLLKIATIPGRPIPHRLEWNVTQAGAYRVVVLGKDTAGKEVTSKPVEIVVSAGDELSNLPLVRLKVVREATAEPRPEARIAPGQFVVQRTGSVEEALSVLVIYSGTATPELDYPRLPNSVTIPAGKEEVALEVIALDDDLVEGEETVVAELVYPPIELDPLALAGALPPQPDYRIDGEHSQAKVVIHDADTATRPVLRIQEPAAGDRFPAGTTISIRALAIDPNGAITRVEFFSGRQSIGVSEITFIREPDPGTPIEHSLEWKGAESGEHRLTARARSSSGAEIEAPVVPISVGDRSNVVVLDVEAFDAKAQEPFGTTPADVGVFIIRRIDGPMDVAVPVLYSVDGGARNGIDFERLSGQIQLPAGAESVRVAVVPIGDKAKEDEERVQLKLESPICPAIFPPPPQCYRIGPKGSAVVVIHDGEDNKNRAPVATIVSPRSGSAFVEGDMLAIRVEARDADGTIERLDLLADGAVLASSKDATFTFEWKGAGVGLHRLTARALDNAGEDHTSPVVTVMVRAMEEVAFVHRDLPPAYFPGTVLDVALLAEPPRGGAAWTVAEVPPTGWVVSEISDEGFFDGATGKVKFGPYTDTQERRLTYRVAAPASASGAQNFTGKSSLDGRTLPVAGDAVLSPVGEHHPADMTPTNQVIVADELTAYAAAWKRGRPWGADGGTIPVAYVTRAGLIWKSGEAYRFDTSAGAPPACWVPSATRPADRALAGRSPGLAVVDVPEGVAERHAETVQKPGAAGRVEIHVQPPLGTFAVAVEENVPHGWQVSAVSDDGVYDPATGRIRWGLFFGDAPRMLTFLATPPAGVAGTSVWKGIVSFDGTEGVIRGVGWIGAGDAATVPRIRGSHRDGEGKVLFEVDAAPDQVLVVEGSDDLKTWTDVGIAVHTGEALEVSDDAVRRTSQRYYRLRPLSR